MLVCTTLTQSSLTKGTAVVVNFVRGKTIPIIRIGVLIFVVSSIVDWFMLDRLQHFRYSHYLGDLVAALLTVCIMWLWSWSIRAKLAKIDAYQSASYYQNLRIATSLQTLSSIFDNCRHNYDSEHEQCRAACRMQIASIKSALGQGPRPDIIHGNGNGKGHVPTPSPSMAG